MWCSQHNAVLHHCLIWWFVVILQLTNPSNISFLFLFSPYVFQSVYTIGDFHSITVIHISETSGYSCEKFQSFSVVMRMSSVDLMSMVLVFVPRSFNQKCLMSSIISMMSGKLSQTIPCRQRFAYVWHPAVFLMCNLPV